jgi:four helix bundle protein
MTPEQLKARSKRFAVEIIALVGILPHTPVSQIIARQIVRSATSAGANYRAACRARSRSEFAAKLGIAEEEADETLYWLELLIEAGLLKDELAQGLVKEVGELVAIFSAGRKTAKMHTRKVDG